MDFNISAFIVDDESDAIWKLKFLLEKYPFIIPIGEETRSIHSVNYILSYLPELIFLDIVMPGLDGFEILKKIKKKNYNPIIVFTTAYDEYAITAIKKAAFDYLLKPIDEEDLSNCIKRVVDRISAIKKSQNISFGLTEREKIVVEFLLQGKTSLEIASILNLSKHTIDTHRRKILKKTNLKSTAHLISRFYQKKV